MSTFLAPTLPTVLKGFEDENEDIIGSATSLEEIVGALARRGCPDLTSSIDLAACSDFPCAGGGFCDVYKGSLHSKISVAIKSLRVYDRPEAKGDSDRRKILKRAARELYYWSKLQHRNVLPLMGLAIFRGHISMVSGWMENGCLVSFLKFNPDADRIGICMDICSGLCYIHMNDMAHGDMKAANVMMSPDGTAMIADFGNAELKDLTLRFTNTTNHGLSVRWAAPELLLENGSPQVSKEADVYAYGMTVLETVTGKVPYEQVSDNRVICLVAYEKELPSRPDTGISDELWDILKLCWTRKPSERPRMTKVEALLQPLQSYDTSFVRGAISRATAVTTTTSGDAPSFPLPSRSGAGGRAISSISDVHTALESTRTPQQHSFASGSGPNASSDPPSPGGTPPLRSPSSNSFLSGSQKKLRNFFGQRPSSKLITSHLLEFFSSTSRKVLQRTARNSMLRADSKEDSHLSVAGRMSFQAPPKSRFSTSSGESYSHRKSSPPPQSSMGSAPSIKDNASTMAIKDRNVVVGRSGKRVSVISSVQDDGDEGEDEEEYDDEEEEEDEGDEGEGAEDPNATGRAVMSSGGKRSIKWIKGALIGSGSFGSVYLGMDEVQGLLMAVKQVELPNSTSQNEERKKSMLTALEREIELLKQLQHENIVRYLDYSIDSHHLNIFLEYVPGGSVATLLRNYGAFEETLARNWVRQILQGLNYLHEREIIHRDIKCGNILVDNKGDIKISGFGLAQKVEDYLFGGPSMHRPSLQGSVFWMAPEVVKQTSYTYKADIWSVGCLVVEMFTGQHPWAQLTQMQAIFKIGSSVRPTIPPEISPEAEDFLNKTFELDYNIRPTAAELLNHPWVQVGPGFGAGATDNAPFVMVTTTA